MTLPPFMRYDSSIDGYIETVTGRGRRLPTDMVAAIQGGRLIEAIRVWKNFSGEGLLESKLFVEAIMSRTASGHKIEQPKMSDSANLPKQDLLLKMLRMTESDNDGQALVAIRKANALLVQNGWSWEKLIHAKITVVEDPFTSKGGGAAYNPFNAAKPAPAPPPPPQRPYTPPRPQASPFRPAPPPPQPSYQPKQPKPSKIFPVVDSTRANRYPGTCYCCGTQADANAGFIFNPSKHNNSAIDKWEIICAPCNASTTLAIPNRKAKQKPSAWANVGLNDL